MTRRRSFTRDALYLSALMLALASLSSGQSDPPRPRAAAAGSIDVTRPPYNARGNGKTDDSAAIQRALDANPGATILLPDTQPGDRPDYYLASSLSLKGNGQRLIGQGQFRTKLKFRAGVSGILTDNNVCPFASIADLTLEGSEMWWVVYPEQAVLPRGFGGGDNASDADGIRIKANFVRVENVMVRTFGRHGVNIGSDGIDSKAFGDNFYLSNVYSEANRGCGLHIQGADTNAGTTVQFQAYMNQLWGIYDRSFLGNTHVSPLTHTNHYDGTPGKAATKVWAAAGDLASGGSYKGANPSTVGSVYINPYAEADQPPAQFSLKDTVIGGDLGSGTKGRHFFMSTNREVVGSYATPFLWMASADDHAQFLVLKAGKTQSSDAHVLAVNTDNSTRWDEVRGAGKTGWEWWEGDAGKGRRRLAFAPGGATTLDGAMVLTPTKDADAPAGAMFRGSDHGNSLCFKDDAGKVIVLGGGSAPVKRVQAQATIEPGKTTVVVQHGLGGQPAPEDVAVVLWGPSRVWLAGMDEKTLTFRTDRAAPASGITFTYSASQ